MSEPSRLDLLRFLERIQLRDLSRTRSWIAEEERRARAPLARRPTVEGPQEQPDWVIQYAASTREAVAVDAAGCAKAPPTAKVITWGQAVAALVEHGVQPCPVCRPDTALGVLA